PAAANGVTEYFLVAAIVQRGNEAELTVLNDPCLELATGPTRATAPAVGWRDRPAGERARDLDHVFLRVPAIDAERVQFEELATVVFVQTAAASVPSGLLVRPSSIRDAFGGVRVGA